MTVVVRRDPLAGGFLIAGCGKGGTCLRGDSLSLVVVRRDPLAGDSLSCIKIWPSSSVG